MPSTRLRKQLRPFTHNGVVNRSRLGKAIGVDRAHMSKILRGQVMPTMRTAKKIATVLNVSLDEVYQFLKQIRGDK